MGSEHSYRLAELSERFGLQLVGDPDCRIDHVDTIQDAGEGAICFLANSKYRRYLETTGASATILGQKDLPDREINALVSDNPYLAYARIARLLNPEPTVVGGIHPSAVVDPTAAVAETAWIGPCAVVEAGAVIADGVFVGPGSVIGADTVIGENCYLVARVTVAHGSRLGSRVRVHPGAVIGSDGFGNANDNGVWEKVPQLGRVVISDDVEIGANTTIDRGALRDTVIEEGVRLDNQIMIAHNVRIGAHSALAGCVGIAGSTTVGRHCTLGGGVGLSGHLEIGDNVHFSGQSLVTRSFKEPGVYSGNLPAVPSSEWRKAIARIRHLDETTKKVKQLEQRIQQLESAAPGAGEEDN